MINDFDVFFVLVDTKKNIAAGMQIDGAFGWVIGCLWFEPDTSSMLWTVDYQFILSCTTVEGTDWKTEKSTKTTYKDQ